MVGLHRLSKKGFIGTTAFLRFMAEKVYLHIGSRYYDDRNPTYRCGTPMGHHPNMTDEKAMRLPKCPKCFPAKQERVVKAQEGWL